MSAVEYHGSDLVTDYLEALGIEYISINPGATLRGLHDTLLRRPSPALISTLHEEIAVAVAHGYAKSARKPMVAAVHDHVGPLHAHMALFNAWADDAPIIVLGGSGPRDTEVRRPWIDWVHTASPTSAPIRDSLKWDTEPASVSGLVPALARAYRLAVSAPAGPVFVALDATLQEARASRPETLTPPNLPPPPVADPETIDRIAGILAGARNPIFLVDRPPPGAMAPLVMLAETLAAGVVDLGSRCSFPSTHWADQTEARAEALAEADVVVLVEPRDALWPITMVDESDRRLTSLVAPGTKVLTIGVNSTRATTPVDRMPEIIGAVHAEGHAPRILEILAELVARHGALDIAARRERLAERWRTARDAAWRRSGEVAGQAPIHPAHLAASLWDAVREGPWQLAYGVLGGWPRRLWDFDTEEAYLGRSGGEGLGYGLPASVGAALAHSRDDTLVVDIQSDGDMLYTPQALWTAAHHRLPLLVVVYDNRAYGRDLIHQRLVAKARGWEGLTQPEAIALIDPTVGFTRLAEGYGVEGIGPVEDPAKLSGVLVGAARTVRTERRPVLVHVICA